MIKSACHSLKDSHLNEPREADLRCLNQECGTVCLEEWWTRSGHQESLCPCLPMEMVQDAHPLCKSVRSTHHAWRRALILHVFKRFPHAPLRTGQFPVPLRIAALVHCWLWPVENNKVIEPTRPHWADTSTAFLQTWRGLLRPSRGNHHPALVRNKMQAVFEEAALTSKLCL